MAACIVEEASLYCQTTTMESTSTSSLETASTLTRTDDHHQRCSLNFLTMSNGKIIDETRRTDHESTRKRQLSRSDAYNSESTLAITGNSCWSRTVSTTNESDAPTTPTRRPTTLFLTTTTNDRSVPLLRTCLSHPSNSPGTFFPSGDEPLTPLKFTSLPELSSPPAKRLRPQTLSFTPTRPAVIFVPKIESPPPAIPPPSTIRFIDASELAEKLKAKVPLTILDCGSTFRHSEHRIRHSILLRVADKISRKRLKTNTKNSSIDNKRLNESHFIVLYDDETDLARRHRLPIKAISCSLDTFANKEEETTVISSPLSCPSLSPQREIQATVMGITTIEQLTPALRCACEEVRRCLTNSSPSILILNTPFSNFLDLYPNLCESLHPRSCPSSPAHEDNNPPSPLTAPVLPNPTTTTTSQPDLDNFPMTHIVNGLFLGGEANAKNLNELASEHIRHIVNVTSHVPLYHHDEKSEQFHYCHLPADDTQKQNLLDYFDQSYQFIRRAIENNEKVLVHCVAGISRSPAIVIGFLMRYAKMSMNDAYELVKRKRSIVSPNLNFMGQLLEYEKKLKQSSSSE